MRSKCLCFDTCNDEDTANRNGTMTIIEPLHFTAVPMARLSSEQSPLLQSTTDTEEQHLHIEITDQETSVHGTRRQIFKHQSCHSFTHCLLTIFWDDKGEHVIRGIASVFLLGSVLGLLLPRSSHLRGAWYPIFSNILGYSYFFAWSLSYYPQFVLNYKRQSTEGLSVDFCILAIYGCACYASLNLALFFSQPIQEIYQRRHKDHISLVEPSDVAFSIHAMILSSLWLGQIWYYNGCSFENRLASRTTIGLLGVVSVFFIAYGLLIMSRPACKDLNWLCNKLNWLDFLYVMSSCKIAIILLSYLPQAVLNFRNNSTEGFNIWGMLLDAFGGILSILQLSLDSVNQHDLSGISGDAAKLELALVSIGFDVSSFLIRVYRDCLIFKNANKGRNV